MNIIETDDYVALRDPINEYVRDDCWYGDGAETLKAEFELKYELVAEDALVNEQHYQGTDRMTVIRRKSDGALLGNQYWSQGGKHGEDYHEPNGDDYGLEGGDGLDADGEEAWLDWYVYTPVEPFNIVAYRHP